jgi:hypothetical protein
MDISYLYHRILQMGRSDLEILLVKDHEFQHVHGIDSLLGS